MLYRIYNTDNDALLGEITEEELATLTNLLEEESAEDRDYYIMADTIDYLQSNGADAAIVALLRKAVGDQEGIEIRWSRV